MTRMKATRVARGMTLRALANKVGTSDQMVQKWEKDGEMGELSKLRGMEKRIAEELGVDPKNLWEECRLVVEKIEE